MNANLKTLHTNNHNVFRLDANNKIVWQVQRADMDYINDELLTQHIKTSDPNAQHTYNPFDNMSTGFFERRPLPYTEQFPPQGQWARFDEYAPGRYLYLSTSEISMNNSVQYCLDPETGIASYAAY